MTIEEVYKHYEETGDVNYQGSFSNRNIGGRVHVDTFGNYQFRSADCERMNIDITTVSWMVF